MVFDPLHVVAFFVLLSGMHRRTNDFNDENLLSVLSSVHLHAPSFFELRFSVALPIKALHVLGAFQEATWVYIVVHGYT